MTESAVMEVGQAPSSDTGVSFGSEFTESPPILATVITDIEVPSTKTKSGRQAQYVVKPLDFETKGAGLSTYVNIPVASTQRVRQPNGETKMVTGYSKRSGLYIVMEAFRRVFFSNLTGEQLKGLKIGAGQLVGLTGWFKRTEVKFGQDEQGNPIVASYFIPIAKATDAEIASAGLPGVTSEPAAHQASFADAELQTMLDFVAGKTPVQYQKAAFKAGPDTLPQSLKDAIVGGTGVKALVDAGLAQVDGDGQVTRLAQPAE